MAALIQISILGGGGGGFGGGSNHEILVDF